MSKEELEKELRYVNKVIEGLRPNDEDRSFYYYQKYELEKKLEEYKESEK